MPSPSALKGVCRHWTALVEHSEDFSMSQGTPETCCILVLLTKSSTSLKWYNCSAIRQAGLQSLPCEKGGKNQGRRDPGPGFVSQSKFRIEVRLLKCINSYMYINLNSS